MLRIELAYKDINHLYKFREFLESNHPIRCQERKHNSCYFSITNKKIDDYSDIIRGKICFDNYCLQLLEVIFLFTTIPKKRKRNIVITSWMKMMF